MGKISMLFPIRMAVGMLKVQGTQRQLSILTLNNQLRIMHEKLVKIKVVN